MKVCKQCNKTKNVSEYYTSRVKVDGTQTYHAICKECACYNQVEYRKKNPKPKKPPREILPCKYCDSRGHNNKLSGEILCPKHAAQFRRHGKILENTRFEQNDYTISDCGKYAIINLRNRRSEKVAETLVDIEDLDKVIGYRIHRKVSHRNVENPLYYAIATVDGKNIRVHHLVLGERNIDHINNDGLDNRRKNLRVACSSKNSMNQRTQARSVSGVTGVIWKDSNSTWSANIKKDGKTRRLVNSQSTFDNAVTERVVAESILFKDFSANYSHYRNTIQLLYHSHDDNKETFIEVDMKGNIMHFHKIK